MNRKQYDNQRAILTTKLSHAVEQEAKWDRNARSWSNMMDKAIGQPAHQVYNKRFKEAYSTMMSWRESVQHLQSELQELDRVWAATKVKSNGSLVIYG